MNNYKSHIFCIVRFHQLYFDHILKVEETDKYHIHKYMGWQNMQKLLAFPLALAPSQETSIWWNQKLKKKKHWTPGWLSNQVFFVLADLTPPHHIYVNRRVQYKTHRIAVKRWKPQELRWQNFQLKCVRACSNIYANRLGLFEIWFACASFSPGNCLQIHRQGRGASNQDSRPWNLWGGSRSRSPTSPLHDPGQERAVVSRISLRYEHLRRALPCNATTEADFWTRGQWKCCKLPSGDKIVVKVNG